MMNLGRLSERAGSVPPSCVEFGVWLYGAIWVITCVVVLCRFSDHKKDPDLLWVIICITVTNKVKSTWKGERFLLAYSIRGFSPYPVVSAALWTCGGISCSPHSNRKQPEKKSPAHHNQLFRICPWLYKFYLLFVPVPSSRANVETKPLAHGHLGNIPHKNVAKLLSFLLPSEWV